MHFYMFFVLSILCVSCAPELAKFKPNHLGISPSIEWEVQKGEPAICKQKIEISADWDL